MESRTYTYLQVSKENYKKLQKVFSWKNEFLRDYVRFDDYTNRLYINHIDELPSVIRIVLASDESIKLDVCVNKDISIESVTGKNND